jgi:SRSO17 transposase
MSKKRSKEISACLGQFLKVLTKPQRPYLLIYLVGLIWLVKFRSIREIASHFGGGNTDGLHHFLKNVPPVITKLQREIQNFCRIMMREPEGGLLILDDTLAPREGKHIEGLGLHHSAKGLQKGLCAVTAFLKAGALGLVFAIRGYCPRKVSKPGTFKSKVDLAVGILEQAFLLFPRGLTVVMDAWYGCAPVLNPIQEAGWTFLAALKQNRYVFFDHVKMAVHLLAKRRLSYKRVKLSKKKRFWIASQIVWLPQVGQVKLFISRFGNEYRFFVTNKLDMTESEMAEIYSQRFAIETFHKDIKQHLGFGELFMRSWTGVQTHWTILAIAYNLVVLSSGPRLKSFRQKIRHFRNTVNFETILKCSIR